MSAESTVAEHIQRDVTSESENKWYYHYVFVCGGVFWSTISGSATGETAEQQTD